MNIEKIAHRVLELETSMPHGAAVELACQEYGASFNEVGDAVSVVADELTSEAEVKVSPPEPIKASDDAEIRFRLGSKVAKKVRARIKKGTLLGTETYHSIPNRAGQFWF